MKKIVVLAIASVVVLVGSLYYHRIQYLFNYSSTPSYKSPSIAVLPFTNLTNDTKQDFFSDGITEGILNSLAHIKGLKVSSRNSSFRFRSKDVDIKEVGKQLSVQTVLEGSFQVQGEHIRVTAQLINVDDGYHFWSEQFDEKSDDVFALEDKIAAAITEKLQLTLLATDKPRGEKRQVKKGTYELYLKGRASLSLGTPADLKSAIVLFENAIQLDSNFAEAYAGLADAYNGMGYGSYISPAEAFPKAKEAALRAIQLDSKLSEPHASLGFVNFYSDWDWQAAEQEFRSAIALNSNYALAFEWYGYYLTAMQRYEEAMVVFQKASSLDPLSIPINTDKGFSLYYSGKYDDAIRTLKKSIEMNPKSVPAHLWLGRSFQQQAKYNEAIGEYEKSLQVATDWPVALAAMGNAYGVSGNRAAAEQLLKKLHELSAKKFVTSYGMALVYAGLDDKPNTFEWLNKAYAEKSNWLVWLKTDPRWNKIKTEREFTQLINKVGLPAVVSGPR